MSARSENYYELFSLAPHASPAELKVAYRRLIRLHHPDIAGPRGEAMTKRINAAWSVLSDPSRRSSYDLSLRQPAAERPAPGPPAAAPRAAQTAP
ncbi:J domain-containing protein, partial [Cryobacterium sp. MLB-32]|uniref:J domain-containing protein n=1 Tax=Cryobacterium sp. MLB-32 TaxID=1529318 RepID=UPI0018CE953F